MIECTMLRRTTRIRRHADLVKGRLLLDQSARVHVLPLQGVSVRYKPHMREESHLVFAQLLDSVEVAGFRCFNENFSFQEQGIVRLPAWC